MKYTLMHKDYEVMDLDIDSYRGFIKEICKVHCFDRLPLSVKYHEPRIKDLTAIREWMQDRMMPVRTDEIDKVLQKNNITIETLSLLSLGLNLTDKYWIKPLGSSMHWDEVNFFYHFFVTKPFEEKGQEEETAIALRDIKSPDYCTNGNLPKFWYKWNGNVWLAKEGLEPYCQEVPNEAIASNILDKAGVSHVPYRIVTMDEKKYSVCPSFVTQDTEYITAYDIWNVIPYKKYDSLYKHFLACAEALEVPDVKEQLDTMLQFDYLINNVDRHLGNFGFIRDVNTLEILSMAPIFDNGNSLWFNDSVCDMSVYKQPAYPFSSKQEKQLHLTAHQVSWLHALTEKDIKDILSSGFRYAGNISEQRMGKIINMVLYKRNTLLDYELQ